MENWSEFECAGRGKTVVFVNGCFDLLHSGHVSLLQFAKLQGDILVVGINSDASVKLSAKGEMSLPARPIISENDRLFLVKALRCVDFAVLFEESDPGKLIERVRPDIIVKGSDYVGKDIPEQWAIDACGCRIIWYDRVNGVSTTGIVEGIKNGL